MNVYYAKTALYAYPNLETVAGQIDEHVERMAMLSMEDFSPCIEQCESIVEYTYQKDCLFALKLHIEEVLERLKTIDKALIGYKYFKQKNNEELQGVNFRSRAYFRRQTLLIEKIARIFERIGLTDKWFEEKCMSIDFFKKLLKLTIDHEKSYEKPKREKVDDRESDAVNKMQNHKSSKNSTTSHTRLIA